MAGDHRGRGLTLLPLPCARSAGGQQGQAGFAKKKKDKEDKIKLMVRGKKIKGEKSPPRY